MSTKNEKKDGEATKEKEILEEIQETKDEAKGTEETKQLDSRQSKKEKKETSSPIENKEALYAPPKKKSKLVKWGKIVGVMGLIALAGGTFLSGKLQ